MGMAKALGGPVPLSTEGVSLPPWIMAIVRKVRRVMLSAEDERMLDLAERVVGPLGDGLLEARDLDDLDDRIDAGLESPAFAELAADEAQMSLHRESESATSPVTAEEIAERGFGAPHLVAQALDLSMHLARAVARSQGLVGKVAESTAKDAGDARPLSFLYDPAIPPEVGACLLASMRGLLCALAVLHAMMSGRKVEPWLARALAERWIDGMRRHLRLLASFPGTEVPLDVVPESERMDLPRLFAEHEAAEERLQRLVAEARASGLPVYPPDAPADDD